MRSAIGFSAATRFLEDILSQVLLQPLRGGADMTDSSLAIPSSALSPAATSTPVANRPMAARTRLLLEGPVLSTLLRLSAPNVLIDPALYNLNQAA